MRLIMLPQQLEIISTRISNIALALCLIRGWSGRYLRPDNKSWQIKECRRRKSPYWTLAGAGLQYIVDRQVLSKAMYRA